ncbi:hypothetical protein [Borrelia persica]|uniref:hypothetical protein n=1 Tax=Borrelia persica TaxID=44448 RepID=UPI000465AFD1|nr:hypothetical protein [Borrelia persica]
MSEFDYKRYLEESVRKHFPPISVTGDSREALLKAFVDRLVEFSKCNVLATSLHAFRMFFAVLGMNEAEDLVLDIINKEKLPLSNNSSNNSIITSCSYTEDEINRIIKGVSKGEQDI